MRLVRGTLAQFLADFVVLWFVTWPETIPVSKNGTKLTKAIGDAAGNEQSLEAFIDEVDL